MYKTIKYSTFIIASLVVALIFVTSQSYSQLSFAIVIYPILVFLAFKLFPRNGVIIERPQPVLIPEMKESEKASVNDADKRAFLKLIGAAGLSFFLLSIFSRKATNIPFVKKVTGPDITALEDVAGNKIDPAQTQPTDGYRISEIDEDIITFYGFIKKGGSWFIMREDTDNGTFRYTRGNSNFSVYWNNRGNLSYDYYSNIF